MKNFVLGDPSGVIHEERSKRIVSLGAVNVMHEFVPQAVKRTYNNQVEL